MNTPRQPAVEPRKHAKESRQHALIEAANAVFAEHGFDSATTREIAERAGCAEGLIHRYFHGKRGLLQAILEAKAAAITNDFTFALPDRDSLRDEIESMLLWHLEIIWERRDFMRVAVSLAAIDPEVARTISEEINTRHRQMIAAKLRRHRDAGRVRPDTDIESIAAAIVGLGFSTGFFLQVCFAQDRGTARHYMTQAAAALASGIDARNPRGETAH